MDDNTVKQTDSEPAVVVLTPDQIKRLKIRQSFTPKHPAEGKAKCFLVVVLCVCIALMLAFLLYTSFAAKEREGRAPNNFGSSSGSSGISSNRTAYLFRAEPQLNFSC